MTRAMSHEAMFGELRSLLQQDPSAHVWTRICGLLRRWPDPERLREQVLPYAQVRLDGWPDALREVPHRERGALTSANLPLWLALCRDVSLSITTALATPEGLAPLTRLSMDVSEDTPWRALRALLESADHPLERVHLSGRDGVDTDSLLDALEPIWARGVRELSLLGLRLSSDALRRLAARLGESGISALSLTGMVLDSTGLHDLLDAGALRACESLMLNRNHLCNKSISALATHENAPSALRTLSLSFNNRDHDSTLSRSTSWAELLSRHAETLCALELDGYRHGAPWYAQALAASPLHALERLSLTMTPITRETMGALANLSAKTPTLREVDLSYFMNPVSDDAFALWRAHEALPWRALDLRSCMLTDAHVETLAACHALAGLEALHLQDDQLTSEGVRALTRSPHLTRLHTLSLIGEWVGDETVRLLASTNNLEHLRTLDLDDGCISDAGVKHLARSETLRLADLSLSGACAEVETWRALGDAPITAQLHSLSLSACELDAARLTGVLAGRLPARLHQLNLSSNPLGADGARALLDAGGWPALDGLVISDTQQTPQSLTALATAERLSDVGMITAGHQPIDSDTMSMLVARHAALKR